MHAIEMKLRSHLAPPLKELEASERGAKTMPQM
jgi:hypothetical protein